MMLFNYGKYIILFMCSACTRALINSYIVFDAIRSVRTRPGDCSLAGKAKRVTSYTYRGES
ncbi:hypothetical protein BCR43DRAFT_490542 [Syncephalastrum racemosum]|uniref:Uncharacterized protein n=1 Tax=Syncephalastrum racemosum TaxID=13706 RepID=A0A1X2HG65_SYNRA|nr:hypothetical protein BCR43DRAFT_490542 [Syncephalastrum racemosum]